MDLKISNVLIGYNGEVKIADFGLARKLGMSYDPLTMKVATLWYRAPEILLKTGSYGKPSDIWAMGCILAELLSDGKPLLPGSNEIDQYTRIAKLIGIPTEWDAFYKLEKCQSILALNQNQTNKISKKFSGQAADLISKMLVWDPDKRISASEALLHDFFVEKPYPVEPHRMGFLKTYLN